MERRLEPEWLDTLPPQDPAALRSRADLRRVNAIMGNAAIVARALVTHLPQRPTTVVELGAGDGAWCATVARRLPLDWSGIRAILLDRQDTIAARTLADLTQRGWQPEVVTADALDWLDQQPEGTLSVVVANLFLHHFDDVALAQLFRRIARAARWLVACEPRRSGVALAGSRLLGLIGCNAVTRHDAMVSVRAGFVDGELSALWPGRALEDRPRRLFSQCFVARGVAP